MGASVVSSTAYLTPLFLLISGIVRNDSIWDWLIFNRVQKGLGGRVKFIASGSAPISGKVLDFLRVACGCLVRPMVGGVMWEVCGDGIAMGVVMVCAMWVW